MKLKPDLGIFYANGPENRSGLLYSSWDPQRVMQTYLSIGREKNGVGLDVSVDDAIGMKESKCLQACLTYCGNLLLIHSVTQPKPSFIAWSE